MSGNVWEWCWDRYSSTPSEGNNPQDATAGAGRITRGGSWDFGADYSARAYRDYDIPDYHDFNLGLRLAYPPSAVTLKKTAMSANPAELNAKPFRTADNEELQGFLQYVKTMCNR